MKQRSPSRLLVFLPPRAGAFLDASAVVGYAGIDGSGKQMSKGDAPLALLPKALSVDLVFDVSDVFTALLDAPPMSEGRLRQAMPSLVEEQMLADSSGCHFAYRLERVEANLTRVAVSAIDPASLASTLEAVTEAKIRPRSAYSALYSIPAPAADTLSIRVTRGRGTVRTGEHAGFAFDLAQGAPGALWVAVQQLGIKRIRLYGEGAVKFLPLTRPLQVRVSVVKRDFKAASIEGAVNLLQGRFAPPSRYGVPVVSALARSGELKPLLLWGAASLAMFVVGLNAYRFKLETQNRTLRSTMQAAFRSTFPSEALVEPMAQAERHLRDLRARVGQFSPDDFSILNAQAAQLLSSLPPGVLTGVDYHDAALTLKFKPDAAGSDEFQSALKTQAEQRGLDLRFEADRSVRIASVRP